jgi:hypothetical protein
VKVNGISLDLWNRLFGGWQGKALEAMMDKRTVAVIGVS